MSDGRRVVVIGGGLAGIAAALDCAAAGARVTLVEVRRRLGGAAYSFERDGMQLDNGQHVFLRCCESYRALLARIGSARHVAVQERLEIPVMSPGEPTVTLRRGTLPPPLHLAGALARYPHLKVTQRWSAALAARALSAVDPADPELDRRTLGDWLSDLGQSERSLAALWDLIALPTLNVRAADASAALGAFVFQTGLLASADAGDIGFHVGTLAQTIGEPAQRALADAGVELRLGWRAQALRRADGGFEVQGGVEDGLSAEAVVVALPHARAARLIEPLLAPTAAALDQIGSSPIVNLHVVFDRVVCEEPFAAGVGTPVQYLFDRSAAAGAPPGCQYLAVSLSGAEREMELSIDRLREHYVPALEALLPAARGARVEGFFATREHAATFRASPGVGALRPPARTEVPGLALAGTWTATGWPATLEGAVISGHAAARVALDAIELAPPSGRSAASMPSPGSASSPAPADGAAAANAGAA
ncbi:MAG TPA: hydroxysqualene dehydroxylase HpnE [Solirubrobacteraceae bacterium]|jgi:squalene-associated FAD-dependent desaturase|nr:hydroxysqualene dehydroxylase HpnE [Solirubrobacteraceae bacterium]